MKSKKALSAMIETSTDKAVRQLAKDDGRSLSQMVDILLKLAVPVWEKKKK